MIIVLHGDDIAASHERLSELTANFKNHLKVNVSQKASENEFREAIVSQDLISSSKVIVAENYLTSAQKIPTKILQTIPEDLVCIFWEKKQLTPARVSSLSKIARLELFKLKTSLFIFLDSLAPKSKTPITLLTELKNESLLWQLQNRILLLILSKLNTEIESAAKITKRNIFDWQWEKIRYQASKFSLDNLLALYGASLRIDLILKSGKTNLPENTLIHMLLLKYLH